MMMISLIFGNKRSRAQRGIEILPSVIRIEWLDNLYFFMFIVFQYWRQMWQWQQKKPFRQAMTRIIMI